MGGRIEAKFLLFSKQGVPNTLLELGITTGGEQ